MVHLVILFKYRFAHLSASVGSGPSPQGVGEVRQGQQVRRLWGFTVKAMAGCLMGKGNLSFIYA